MLLVIACIYMAYLSLCVIYTCLAVYLHLDARGAVGQYNDGARQVLCADHRQLLDRKVSGI